jgi:hypothetical protein
VGVTNESVLKPFGRVVVLVDEVGGVGREIDSGVRDKGLKLKGRGRVVYRGAGG